MKQIAPFEIKALDDDGSFEGYGSVFDVQDMDGDVIMRGAFANTIEKAKRTGRMPKMLWQHRVDMICGKWLDMYEDAKGLYVKGKLLLSVEKGREAYALMKEGVLDGMSVGFNIVNGSREAAGKIITEADLWEVSLVTWGANPDALITAVKARDSIRDFERFLREAGFSRKEATAIAASGYKAIDQCETESDGLDKALVEKLVNLQSRMRVMQ